MKFQCIAIALLLLASPSYSEQKTTTEVITIENPCDRHCQSARHMNDWIISQAKNASNSNNQTTAENTDTRTPAECALDASIVDSKCTTRVGVAGLAAGSTCLMFAAPPAIAICTAMFGAATLLQTHQCKLVNYKYNLYCLTL
ncbi:MAG: hypothetical protein MJK12_18590 [Colwellia sp.]|nr:hypothetical protein [Colwellia sp.]